MDFLSFYNDFVVNFIFGYYLLLIELNEIYFFDLHLLCSSLHLIILYDNILHCTIPHGV